MTARARGRRRSREQSAAAARHEQEIERAGVLEQLACGRSLPGDDVGVIVRRYKRQAALPGQAAADLLAVLSRSIVCHHFAAIGFSRAALDRRRIGRHDDHARDVEELTRQRHGLRVIARRKGDDAASCVSGREPGQCIVGAAEFEGAAALKVLALEEQVGAGAIVEETRGGDRGPMRDAGNTGGSRFDVGEGRKRHGSVGAGRHDRRRRDCLPERAGELVIDAADRNRSL